MFGSARRDGGRGFGRALDVFSAVAVFLAPCAAARGSSAEPLVINEVLYDPTGADTGLEFVEILNVGAAAIDLGRVRLESGDGSAPSAWRLEWSGPEGVEIPPGGFWCVGESAVMPPPQAVTDLDLQNGPDACRLLLDGVVCDLVGWGAHTFPEYYRGAPASDASGASLGRVPDGADTGDNARDFTALDTPSPGEPNAFAFDLALAGAERDPALPDAPSSFLWRVTVVNVGISTAAGAVLHLEGPATAVRAVPSLDRSESAVVEMPDAVGGPGVETRLLRLAWSEDRHAGNDTLAARFRAGPGPLLFNEIAYAPPAETPEWIEIVNASVEAVDPSGWSLADSRERPVFFPEGLAPLAPGGFIVVGQAPLEAVETIVPQGAWPSLNSTRQAGQSYADRLRLADADGLSSDEVAYAPDWGGGAGVSLERVSRALPSREASSWGSCADPGGATPGRANSIALALPSGSGVRAEPSPFSPDGDGLDDRTLIAFEVPPGSESASARIYDLTGREVRDLGSLANGRARVIWDGRDDGGREASVGLYVIVATGERNDGSAWRLAGDVVLAPRVGRR